MKLKSLENNHLKIDIQSQPKNLLSVPKICGEYPQALREIGGLHREPWEGGRRYAPARRDTNTDGKECTWHFYDVNV